MASYCRYWPVKRSTYVSQSGQGQHKGRFRLYNKVYGVIRNLENKDDTIVLDSRSLHIPGILWTIWLVSTRYLLSTFMIYTRVPRHFHMTRLAGDGLTVTSHPTILIQETFGTVRGPNLKAMEEYQ